MTTPGLTRLHAMTHIRCLGLAIYLTRLEMQSILPHYDLKSGYWQIPVHSDDREKTAFVTHGGLYEFNRMPKRG